MVVKLAIPENARLLVKQGQKVKIGDPFYSTVSEEDSIISFVNELGIKAQDIFKYAKVVVGDTLQVGDIVGERKRLMGKKTIKADTAGKVKHIDFTSGVVVVGVPSKNGSTVPTFFTGEITHASDSSDIIQVEIGNAKTYEATGNVDCGGESHVLLEKEFFSYSSEDIRDRIMIIHTIQSHIEAKIDALGGAGIIYVDGSITEQMPSVKVSESDLEKLIQNPPTYILFSTTERKLFGYN